MTEPLNPSTVPENSEDLLSELRLANATSGKVGHLERIAGVKGSLIFFFRRICRRLLVWYTAPLQEHQAHVTRALNLLAETVGAKSQEFKDRIQHIEQRLLNAQQQLLNAEQQLLNAQENLVQEAQKIDRNLNAHQDNVEAEFSYLRQSLKNLRGELQDQLHLAEYYLNRLGSDDLGKPVIRQRNWRNRAEARQRPFGINVLGAHLSSEKGIGEAARASIRSLEQAAIPFSVRNYPDAGSENLEPALSTGAGQDYRFNLIHVNAADLASFAREKAELLASRYNIGYWNWELADFPWDWYSCFRSVDEVWAPSTFVCAGLEKISPVPVLHIPYSLEPYPALQPNRKRFDIDPQKFMFLFVFDFQSIAERKNPTGLVEAFRMAFGDGEEAVLVLKCAHSWFAPGEMQRLRELAVCKNVRIIDTVLRRADLQALLQACDCYVSLHRCEGFGLSIAEAMNFGKPVIATAYSGNMDFMNSQNSFPVQFKLGEIHDYSGPYRPGFSWAEPDLEHAAELMQQVCRDRDLASQIGKMGQATVQAMLSPAMIGERVQARLQELNCRVFQEGSGCAGDR